MCDNCINGGPLTRNDMTESNWLIGDCFAIQHLTDNETFNIIKIFIEDDGYYHETNLMFHPYWANDLIALLQNFANHPIGMNSNAKTPR